MKALLICPDQRAAADFIRRQRPLALLPVFGRTLLDHWLEHLAVAGVKHVTILAADRPDEIRSHTDHGDCWGLTLTVLAVKQEPTSERARAQYISDDAAAWHSQIVTLETLPAMPTKPLWTGPNALFQALTQHLSNIKPQSCLTMRKIASGVYVSTRAHIAASAKIVGPAWIGPGVIIADHAHVLPYTIIEPASYIDRHASVGSSWIGPGTYVGAMTEVADSFAWGTGLENWQSGSFLEVADEFLLSSLHPQRSTTAHSTWITRLLCLLLLIMTSPLALLCAAWARLLQRLPATACTPVTLPHIVSANQKRQTIHLHQLCGVEGLFARWPELWQVWCGRMRLVGNRPLSPARAALLDDEFERLWLSAPAGVFSLADAMSDGLEAHEYALSHSACYAVRRSWRLDLRILTHCLPRFLMPRLVTAHAAQTDIISTHTPHTYP